MGWYLKREDYIFVIGFDGSTAFVNKNMRSIHRSKSARELADDGLFPEAYRSAVFDKDEESAAYVLEKFNQISSVKYDKVSDLDRLFGVQSPDTGVTGIIAV